MTRFIPSRAWKAKGPRLPKTVIAAKARNSKKVRVVKPAAAGKGYKR